MAEYAFYALFYLIIIVFGWFVLDKAGFPGVWAIFLPVPGVNLVVVLIFLFVEWPIRKELERYRKRYGELTEKDDEAVAASTPSMCMSCGVFLAPGQTTCNSCGWSYLEDSQGDSKT